MRQLKKGGKIAIVSPSGRIDEEILSEGIKKIEAKGFAVEVMPHVVGCSQSVFSASDKQRAEDLVKAIEREDIDAILCARGGYGAVRTLQNVDEKVWANCDKWIVGFSDITAIHQMMVRFGHESMHGPMVKHIAHHGMESPDVAQMFDVMMGGEFSTQGVADNGSIDGEAEGVLIGGNLSIVYSLRSTPADINPDGKILFLEDLSEYNYHVDRMIQNLKYSGALERINGLVLGQFTGMKDGATKFGKDATEIIVDVVREYGYPVWTGFEAGHAQEVNRPLVMGRRVRLIVKDGKGKIDCNK